MDFLIYDVLFLIVFAILVSIFLYTKKNNLQKEGFLLLYKASWGIKLIESFSKRYKKTLKFFSYISIAMGYLLMTIIIYLFGKIIWIYLFVPEVVKMVKIPPIMPLIPYLPRLFNLDAFLPPFYFIYWIIIIAIVAIPHEFAHGIYAAYNKVKIKSTGFGFFPFFLPVFLAAFVEQDESQMTKKSKFNQMAILSAGTFANILTAIFFFAIMWIFFSFAFVPAGVEFTTYSYSPVNVSEITNINGVELNQISYLGILDLLKEDELNEISTNGDNYLLDKNLFDDPRVEDLFENGGYVLMNDDAPAIRSKLVGAITEINLVQIAGKDMLSEELQKYSPGDVVNIKTITKEGYNDYNLTLGERQGTTFLGIAFIDTSKGGMIGKISDIVFFKEPHVYYKPLYNSSMFFYNLLWWLVLICISVALVNMLPVGIFDGGRFFYLTIVAITGSESKAKKAFSFVTYMFLFLLLLIMVFWALRVL